MCLQEVEIESGYDPVSLNLKDDQFELEVNSVKLRTEIYIKKSIAYRRRYQLEGADSHIAVIDLKDSGTINHVINVYRSFNPQNKLCSINLLF